MYKGRVISRSRNSNCKKNVDKLTEILTMTVLEHLWFIVESICDVTKVRNHSLLIGSFYSIL